MLDEKYDDIQNMMEELSEKKIKLAIERKKVG